MNKLKMFLCACLCVLAVLPALAKGDVIQVYSKAEGVTEILSDLTVYGDNNKKQVILSTNFPKDDVSLSPSLGYKMYDVKFEVTKYIISSSGKDSEGNYYELPTSVLVVQKVVPKKLAFIEIRPYLQEQFKVILEIDQAVAPEPPPEGTILAFVEGYDELMPGWFVGTGINFDTGEVTGAYTGNVEVFCTAFEVLVFTPPYPPDGAVGIDLDDDLCWPESKDADSYDVYFGTDFNDMKCVSGSTCDSGLSVRTYDPGTLEPCTTYYWKIDKFFVEISEVEIGDRFKFIIIEKDEVCDEGPVWSFTTAGRKATNPYPVDGAIHVGPNVLLSWTPGCLAAFHDVYFGPDFYAVANADTYDTTGIYRGRLAFDANSYDPAGLELGTPYYWRIDQVATDGTTTGGEVWSFTTIGGSTKASNPYPVDGATDVPTDVVVSWTPVLHDDLGFATASGTTRALLRFC